MDEETKVDKWVARLKNNRVFACVIVLAIIVLGVAAVMEAIEKAGEIFAATFARTQAKGLYDVTTRETIIAAARKMDGFLLRLEADPDVIKSRESQELYLDILADMRSIKLRNVYSPLSEMADRDVQGMIDHWQSLWAAIRNGELTAKEVAVLRDCELIVLTGLLRVDRAYWER